MSVAARAKDPFSHDEANTFHHANTHIEFRPHFYIVKLGFTWGKHYFLIFAFNINCGYSLELPQ